MKIGGKIEEIELNGYIVSVITPKENISYEEGVKRIDKILAEEAAKQKYISLSDPTPATLLIFPSSGLLQGS